MEQYGLDPESASFPMLVINGEESAVTVYSLNSRTGSNPEQTGARTNQRKKAFPRGSSLGNAFLFCNFFTHRYKNDGMIR